MFGINRTRNNYWSNSRLADYIRGENKPTSLPFKDWNLWEEETKKKNGLRYYIAKELLDRLQDIISLPFDIIHAIKIYVRNRYIDKIHYLKTGLEPGTYYDLDHRILHGLFNELVDFVEIEHASRYRDTYAHKYKYTYIRARCAEAGLDYLKWAANRRDSDNSPTSEAIFSMKTLNLYFWWKNRPNRACPYDLYSKTKDGLGLSYHKKIHELETVYEEEDTKMLIELIKIRGSLWT